MGERGTVVSERESGMGVDPPQRRAEQKRVLAAVVLALPLVFAIYANGLRGPFQFDDRHAIVENAALRAAVVDSTWWGPRAWTIGAGHYRPLTFVTYAMNIRLGGLDPFGFHLANVVLHWASTAAVMWLLWLLLGRAASAIAGGLVFAVTPANSEAVNYLAARSSLLVGLWGAVAVASFVLFRRSQAAGRQRAALAAGAGAVTALGLGLASKETAVTIPLAWLLYDVGWSRAVPRRALFLPYAVVGALGASYFGTTGYARTLWAVLSGAPTGDRNVWVNLWSQLAAFPLHVVTFGWPFSLTVLHDVPVLDSPWRPAVFAGAALALAVFAMALRWLVRGQDTRKAAGFLLLWWLVSLVPAMVYPLHVLFQEHRDYLPWMGLAGATGVAAGAIWDGAARRPGARWVLVSVGLVALVLSSAATIARNLVWTDELRLWTDAAAKSPAHPVVRLNLGNEYARRGDGNRALAEYQEAIRLQPDYGLAYHNIGLLHVGRGEYVEARAALEHAVALTPDAAEPLAALGSVYDKLGDAARAEAALTAAGAALQRRPHPPAARLAVADALAKSARPGEAAAHYQAVLAQERSHPSFLSAKAYLGLGYVAERAGRPDEALAAYAKALEIDPRLNDALFNSANVLLAAGRYPEATVAYERVLANTPSFFPARFNLGRLYERDGRRSEANREYQAFLRDAPPGPAYAAARDYAASRVGVRGPGQAPTGALTR